MDRKAWLLLGPVALIGVGAYIWLTDAPRAPASSELDADAPEFSDPEVLDAPRGQDEVPPVLGAPPDAGPLRAAAPGESTSREGPPGDPIAPPEEARAPAVPDVGSSGFQLGVARRRAELLEGRVSGLRERVERLEAEDPALAARQRAVLERIEARLGEVRAAETRLDEAARAEGTLGEAEQGYESEAPAQERPVEARLPTAAP
ncbi:MAG: hypothetical protein RID93_36495 [Sandaracinaceae bacterium]